MWRPTDVRIVATQHSRLKRTTLRGVPSLAADSSAFSLEIIPISAHSRLISLQPIARHHHEKQNQDCGEKD